MPEFLKILTLTGTFAFAVSGAIQAARHRMDIIGLIFIGCITALGGGTFRDLLLGVEVFWLGEWHYVVICILAAVVTYFSARWIKKASVTLLWVDALGMSMFSVLGAQKAFAVGLSIPVATIMGMFSACLGGIVRDIILNELPIILHRDIYVTASLIGALTYLVVASQMEWPQIWSALIGCSAAFIVRALAIGYKLSIPPHPGLD